MGKEGLSKVALTHCVSAINNQFCPCHPTRLITCQEKAAVSDVDGLAKTAHRGRGEAGDRENRVFIAVPGHPRGDHAGMDRIRADVLRRVLQRCRFRRETHRSFGGVIGRARHGADKTVDRGDVDD